MKLGSLDYLLEKNISRTEVNRIIENNFFELLNLLKSSGKMPFTFNQVAVMPFTSWGQGHFSTSEIVIRSMNPDFEFMLKLHFSENVGHHWYGIALNHSPIKIHAVWQSSILCIGRTMRPGAAWWSYFHSDWNIVHVIR